MGYKASWNIHQLVRYTILRAKLLKPSDANAIYLRQNISYLDPTEVRRALQNVAVKVPLVKRKVHFIIKMQQKQKLSFVSLKLPYKTYKQTAILNRLIRFMMLSSSTVFSVGEHTLDILSPLQPFLPGLPVFVTQNISPKLGLRSGSTRTIVAYQFQKMQR